MTALKTIECKTFWFPFLNSTSAAENPFKNDEIPIDSRKFYFILISYVLLSYSLGRTLIVC